MLGLNNEVGGSNRLITFKKIIRKSFFQKTTKYYQFPKFSYRFPNSHFWHSFYTTYLVDRRDKITYLPILALLVTHNH
jgi:hypothetical protein